MNYKDLWNKIVSDYNTKQYALETTVQELWESYFSEIFSYKKIFDEINSQRNIPIGVNVRAVPDIILRKNGCDIIDVELKKYSLTFSERMEDQLISYMNQLHVSVGIIVCHSIYIYVYHYDDKKIKKLEIPFQKDNPDGEKFIELFQRDNFSEADIEAFIDSKQNFEQNVEKIKKETTEELVLKLLGEHFEKDYTKQEFEAAIKDVIIKITKGSTPPPPPPPPPPGTRKYLFEGVWYNKSRLVLAVVKAYVRDNPSVSYSELLRAFPKELQGSYGVILTYAEANSRTKELRKRFFADHPIHLQDGNVVLVCTQWGSGSIGNIEKFIRRADFLGYKIEGEKE